MVLLSGAFRPGVFRFRQMPIFKRYYLADIPGLAWTADFYITLYIHYVAAALFIGLSVYYLITRVFTGVLRSSMDRKYWWRGGIFLWMIFTGAILVTRNLPRGIARRIDIFCNPGACGRNNAVPDHGGHVFSHEPETGSGKELKRCRPNMCLRMIILSKTSRKM